MSKGNPVIRVADEFKKMVSDYSRDADKTSAEITREFARLLKKK